MKTTHQYITRNMKHSRGAVYAEIERIILYVLKKFRFIEWAEVVSVWPSKGRIKCRMINQKGKISKWMKVMSSFASNDEGIYAMPNVGDFGYALFVLGDLCNGFYVGSFWGEKTKVPTYSQTGKEIVIKRNKSLIAIEPSGNIRALHHGGNQVALTPGFVTQQTPDGQKNVVQKYHVTDRETGTSDAFSALAYTKNEARKQKDVVLFKRTVEEPEGSIFSTKCLVDEKAGLQELPDGNYTAYVAPTSSSDEVVKQVRAHRYKDIGNSESGVNAFGWTKTEEHYKVPAGEDLAKAEPTGDIVFQRVAESSHNIWINERCYASFDLRVMQKSGGEAYSAITLEVWADGFVDSYVLVPSNPDPTGEMYQRFERKLSREDEKLEEVDGVFIDRKEF